MLDLKELRRRCAKGEIFSYFYFWGHQPKKDGSIGASCFSQWFDAGFEIDGTIYSTAEHWMMAAKARLFSDHESLEQILIAGDPSSAKALGRGVKGFDNDVWKAHRRRLVTEGNLAKFSQNAELGSFLRSTEGHVLVEASPYDRIWGIGLLAADEKAQHPDTWQGENLLGFALMDVRMQLAK